MGAIKLAWIAMIVNTIDVLICIAIAIILAKKANKGGETTGDLSKENQINPLVEELTAVKAGYSAIKKENLELKNKLADSETELQKAVSKYFTLEKDFKKSAEDARAAKTKDVRLEDLNSELSKQKKLFENRRAELDKLIKENLEVKDKLFKAEAELKAAHEKYSGIEKDSKKNIEELQSLKAKAAKAEGLSAQDDKLKKEIESSHSVMAKFKKECEEKGNRILSLQDEVKKVKDDYAAAHEELKALKKGNSESKDNLARKEGELKEALSKYSQIEKEFQHVSEELKAFKVKNVKLSDFNAEVEKLKKEIELQHNNNESLKKKDENNIKKINSLQEELKAGQDSYSVARSELQEVSKKALDFSKEITQQKALIDANKAELERLRQENPGLREKLADKDNALQNAFSEYSALEKDFEKLSEELDVLKIENEGLISAQAEVEKEKEAEILKAPEVKENAPPVGVGLDSLNKYTQILEIMAQQNFISRDALTATLAYYEKSGGNFVKYLMDCCHIDELTLAQTICHQFGVPYLPLSSYDISEEIIKLVPRDIVEEYWLMPLQRSGNSLTVVMSDPFDARAINTIEKITGYKVQAFIGVLSDIIQAMENYYKVALKEGGYKGQESTPIFITTQVYKGIDRRQGTRFEIGLSVSFPYRGSYNKAVTKDVSQGGFLFDSEVPLDIGSVLPLQVDLPKEINLWPILAVVQVLRAQSSQDGKFNVAVKIIKISKEEIDMIINYALEHKGK